MHVDDKSEWRAWIESSEIPADEWSDRVEVLLEELSLRGAHGPVGWGAGWTLGAVFGVAADDVMIAAIEAGGMFREALALATKGLEEVKLRRFEIAPSDFEPLDLLGASDVAQVLNLSRQRVYQLLDTMPGFPSPVAKLTRGLLWSRHDIETWRDGRDRPERPIRWWVVELAMRLTGRPPRVRDPSAEQKQHLMDELNRMHHARGETAAFGWRSDREFWTRFTIQAASEREAKESAARLMKHKAERGAGIALADDLAVKILDIEELAS